MSSYEVIQSVLEERGLGNKIRNYSYKNEGHFKELWGFDSSLSTGNIVIVWDDIPLETSGSPVRTKKYLTPIDWAVGFSLSIKEGIEQNTYPDLRILIVAVGSQPVSFSDSLKIVYQLCNKEIVSMPWIRIFSITASASGRDIDAFYRTLEKPETLPSMKEALDAKTHDLDSVKGIWAASLTRPSTQGDHHAIANLVGPLLLMEEGGDIHVNALQTLMRSIGLLPDCKKGDENAKALLGKECSWVDWQEPEWQWKLNELLRNRNDKLNLILIDDMFQMGWGKILCRAVGVDYNEPFKGDGKNHLVKISKYDAGKGEKIVVKAASSAEWILEKLEKLGEKKDNRFEFFLDDSIACPEILFLDLRLYSGYFDTEVKEFFSKLADLANGSFKEGTNKNLPWPGITNDEIEKIQKWIVNTDKKQEDPVYVEALTLLPRILALTDLSLPIVLFSSTGRRDITEKLKPYKNIITVFEKPRFTVDIPFDIAWQTKKKFQEAFGKALSIIQARQKCRTIIESGNVKAGETVMDFSNQKGIHIELFIDECLEETSEKLDKLPSGINFPDTIKEKIYYNANNKSLIFKKGEMKSGDLKVLLSLSKDEAYQSTVKRLIERSRKQDEVYVGGLFAIFSDSESIKDAREKADKFDDDLVINNVRYFDSLGVGVQRTATGIRGKGVSSAQDLFKTMKDSRHKPDYLGFIGLRHLLPDTADEFDLFNPRSADNLFRITLTALIELFLSETLSALFGLTSDKVSVSVYAGTRVKYYNIKSEVNKAMFHFGATSFPAGKGYLLHSINKDSVCPIISDIINFHNIKRKIHRAAGIKLPYKNEHVVFPSYFICRKCEEVVFITPNRDIKKSGKEASLNIKLECQCKDNGSFSPDYRVLHYIADEILNHIEDVYSGNNYGESIKEVLGGFDDVFNEDLKSVIKASRYLDIGEIVSAIAEVKVTKDYKLNGYSAKPLLIRRIASKLDTLTGGEFSKLIQYRKITQPGTKEGGEVDQIVKGGRDDDAKNVVNPQTSGITVKVEQIKKRNCIINHSNKTDKRIEGTITNLWHVDVGNIKELKSGLISYKEKTYVFFKEDIKCEHANKLCKTAKVSFVPIQNSKGKLFATKVMLLEK